MTQVNGLPAHILLVHLIVVLVPLTAISLLFCAFWPGARRRLVWLTLVLSFAGLVLTPVTTQAGEWLERRVDDTPLVRTHAELGDGLLPWTIGLFLLSALVAVVHVRQTRRRRAEASVGQATRAPEPDSGDPAASAGTELLTETRSLTVAPERSRLDAVIAIAVPVLAVVLAVGSTVEVYRIGDSGAQAVWQNNFSSTPHGDGGGDQDQGD